MTRQSLLRSPGVHRISVSALVLAAVTLGLAPGSGTTGPEFTDSFEVYPGPWQPEAPGGTNLLAFEAPSADPAAADRASGAWDGMQALKVTWDGTTTSPVAELKGTFFSTRPVALRVMLYVPSSTARAMGQGDMFRLARVMQDSTDSGANLELWVKKENGAIHVEGGLPGNSHSGSASLTDIAPDTWHTVLVTYEEFGVIVPLTCDVRLYVDDLLTSRDQATGLSLLNPPSGAVGVGMTGAAQGSGSSLVYWLDDVKVGPDLNMGLGALNHLQQDGYETANVGVLPAPSGKARVAVSTGGGTVKPITNGHRGGGMEANDTSTSGSAYSAAYGELAGASGGLKLYHRAWWHQGASAAADAGTHGVMGISADALQGPSPLFNPMAALSVGPQGVFLSGYSLAGSTPVADPVQPLFGQLDGGWHLLELMVAPTSGDGGVRMAWVDGRQVPSSGASWPPPVRPQRWIDGHPPDAVNPAYQGPDEYDDSRTSVLMQPSQFGLMTTAVLDAGTCSTLLIRAIDSANGFSPPAEDVWLSYDTHGAGAFYVEPSCATALPVAASIVVPSGQTSAVAYFLPSGPGVAQVTLSHPDYLSRDFYLYISGPPDGGTSDGGAPPDTVPPTAPGQPNFSSTVTRVPVQVTWAGSRDDGGSGLRKYLVEASAFGGPYVQWDIVPSPGEGVPAFYTFDGGEAYWTLRVRAEDGQGNLSGYSTESVRLTMDLTPPSPLVSLPSGTIDGGIATVFWGTAFDPPPAPSGIQFYMATWTSTPPGDDGSCDAGLATNCSFPVTPGHQYTLAVHAQDFAGNAGVDAFGTLTSPGPVRGLRLLGFPAGPSGAYAVVGDPTPVTVEAYDVNGAVVPGYLGTVRFEAQDAGGNAFPAVLPGVYQFVVRDQGRHDFRPGFTFNGVGNVFARVKDQSASTISGEVSVTVIPRGDVVIIREANLFAARGLPYQYSPFGAVRAVSSRPVTFSTCDSTPGDFLVDATGGAVSWTPSASTSFPVSICVHAQADSGGGEDFYRFQVNERPPSTIPPRARFVASPSRADVGVNVAFDSSASTVDLQLGPPAYRWRFGDGSPLSFRDDPFRGYLMPGGYRPSLVLADGVGRTDETSRPVQVADRAQNTPPIVTILTPPPSGVNALDVALQAEVDGGSSAAGPIRWDLGNGAFAEGPDAGASYGPGRYWATASAVDQNGLPATDKVEIAVAQDDRVPPFCAATVDPTFVNASGADGGRASVDWIAWRAPGTKPIASVTWSIDGVAFGAGEVNQQYSTAGWRRGTLTVTDEDGLQCTDQVAMLVVSGSANVAELPPRILDPGVSGPIDCSAPYVGRPPIASGTGPLRWSKVDSSQEVSVDGAGTMTWTPVVIPDLDQVTYTLRVSNTAGFDQVAVKVPYQCKRDVLLKTCGCGEGGGAPAVVGLALLALWAASRRRSAAPARGRRP